MSLSLRRALKASTALSAPARGLALRAAWLAIARLGSQALMVVFTGLVARRLGSAGLGQYAFMAALLMVANTLSTFGTDSLLIRRLRSEKDWSLLGSALAIQLVLSGSLIGAAFAWQVGEPTLPMETRAAWRVFALALIPLAFYGVFSAALRAYERMGAYMLLSLASALLQTVGVAFALRPSAGLLGLAYLLLIAQTAGAAFAAAFCISQIRGFRLSLRLSWHQLTSALAASWPLAALGLLTILHQRLGIILLGVIGGPAVTGWFAAAARVVEASKLAHNSLSGALLPALGQAELGARDRGAADASRQALGSSWKALFVLSIVAALTITVFAEPLSRLLFGGGFGPTASALRVLAWALIPFTLNAYFSLTHVAAGTERPALVAVTAGILVFALLGALWIPRWGLMGASWSTVIAECSQAGVYLIYRFRTRSLAPFGRPAREA